MESQNVKAIDIFKLKLEKQQKSLQTSLKLAREDMELQNARFIKSLRLEKEQKSKLEKNFELAVKEMELRQAKGMELFIRNLEVPLLELAAAFKLSEEEREFCKVVEKNKNIQEIARLKRVNARLQEELEKKSDVHEEEKKKMIFHQSEYRKHVKEKINQNKIEIEEKDLVIESQNAIIRSQTEKNRKQDANIKETGARRKTTMK